MHLLGGLQGVGGKGKAEKVRARTLTLVLGGFAAVISGTKNHLVSPLQGETRSASKEILHT